MRGGIATDLKRIIRKQYQQCNTNELDNLVEVDKETNYQKLTQERNRIGAIFIKEIKLIGKVLPTQKTPGPDGITGEFCQTLNKNTSSTQILPEK